MIGAVQPAESVVLRCGRQIVAHDPAAIHVIIQDGAGFHLPENDPRLPANVRIITLPAYSPELNPVERFFQELRRKLKFRVFDSLDAAERFVGEALKEFLTDTERVKSCTATR